MGANRGFDKQIQKYYARFPIWKRSHKQKGTAETAGVARPHRSAHRSELADPHSFFCEGCQRGTQRPRAQFPTMV